MALPTAAQRIKKRSQKLGTVKVPSTGFKGESISQAFLSRTVSRGGGGSQIVSDPVVVEGGKVISGKTRTIEQVRVEEIKRQAEEKAKAEQAEAQQKQQDQETVAQQALILTAAQQEQKASPRFEALRASRLAELKKEIKEPQEVTAGLAGGRIQISGEVSPFKTSKDILIADGKVLEQPIKKARDIKEIEKDVELALKREEAKKELQKKQEEFKEKFFKTITTFKEIIPGGTGERVIGEVRRTKGKDIFDLSFRRESKKLEKEQEAFLKTFYPVPTEKFTPEDIIKFSTALDIGKASGLMKRISEAPPVSPLQEAIATSVGKKTTTLEASEETGKFRAKEATLSRTTITPEFKTERIVFGQLEKEFQLSRQRGLVRDIKTTAVTSLIIAGAGPVIGTLSTIPGAKIIGSRAVSNILLTGFVGSEVLNIGIGAKSIAEGDVDVGTRRIAGTIARGAGTVVGITGLKSFQARAKKDLIQRKQLIDIEKTPELSKKELKFLDKIKEVRTKQELKQMEELVGKTRLEDSVVVDLSKLKQKQLKQLIALQEAEKISTAFELTTKPTEIGEVGFTIEGKGRLSKLTTEENVKTSKKLLEGLSKNIRDTQKSIEMGEIAEVKRLTSPELEIKIRAEMKRTGKTAREIFKDIQDIEKVIIGETAQGTTQKLTPKKVKKIITEIDSAPSKPLRELGVFKSLSGERQQLLLIEEEQIIRGLKPVEEIIFPSLQKLQTVAILKTQPIPSIISAPRRAEGVRIKFIDRPTQVISVGITKPESQIRFLTKERTATKISTLQQARPIQAQRISTITSPVILTETQAVTKQTLKQNVIQDTQLITQQSIIQTGITKQGLTIQQILTPKTTTTQIPKIPGIRFPIKEKPGINIFTAEVRREGRFVEVGSFETPFAATRKAREVVSTSAAASLRVRGPFGFLTGGVGLPSDQFRASEKEEGVFIEKKEKRIKSAGELREITFKGIAAQRAKGVRSRSSIFSGGNSNTKSGLFGKNRASAGVFK